MICFGRKSPLDQQGSRWLECQPIVLRSTTVLPVEEGVAAKGSPRPLFPARDTARQP
jgi:hypothetical protein